MAKQTAIYQAKGYTTSVVELTPADTTVAKLFVTPSADDSVIKSILITSSDSVARDVQLIMRVASVDYVIGTLAVPANSGRLGSVAAVDGLSMSALPLDRVSKKVLPIKGTAALYLKAVATITASTQITAVAVVEDF